MVGLLRLHKEFGGFPQFVIEKQTEEGYSKAKQRKTEGEDENNN